MKNSIYIILSLFLLCLSHISNAQDFVWAKQMGGTGFEGGTSISHDSIGNVYTTGSFSGLVDFDPSSAVFGLTSIGSADIFITKFDASGNFLWAKQIGGIGDEFGSSIFLDASGNVYTTGGFSGTVDFDPSTGIFNLISTGNFDVFISKLDAAGNFIWAKQMGGASSDRGKSLCLDALGNIFIIGVFEETADFDPGVGIFNLTSAGRFDVFISKLDASGNFLWATKIGSSGINGDDGNSITLDAFGNVYTTGSFEGIVDFDPSINVFNLNSPFGGTDIFILKLDNTGNFEFAKQLGGTSFDVGNSLKIDVLGNVYTTGSFQGTADFDPGVALFNLTSTGGLADIFISKLDAAGNFVWAKKIGGTGFDTGNSISLDASGNVYTIGTFSRTVDFDPNAGVFNLTSKVGSTDIFISKLDPAGNFVWALQIGGNGEDASTSITLDPTGNVYSTGSFSETVDFDPGLGIVNLTSTGFSDIFISKLSSTTTGLSEISSNSDINIYPNPTKNQINFSVETNVQLINITGQLIVEKNNVSMLDLSEQVAGLYFITLMDKKGKVIQRSKIIKE